MMRWWEENGRGSAAGALKEKRLSCETRGERAGFLAMEVLESVSKAHVAAFAKGCLMTEQTVFTDAFSALNSLAETQLHCAEVTPPKQASRWLPWVHIAIANLKRFLLGTFHGVSAKYLQEYLNEFCYRFNRRFWEEQLPTRLLNLCLEHTAIKLG
jgi:transposase-like protein